MEGEEVTSQDILNVVSEYALPFYGTTVFEAIYDWIANGVSKITSAVASWWWGIWGKLKKELSDAWDLITSPIRTAIDWIKTRVQWVLDTAHDIWSSLSTWIRDAWHTVYEAASSAITTVKTWLSSTAHDIMNWVTTQVREVRTWVTTTAIDLGSKTWAWLQELWAWLKPQLQNLHERMEPAVETWTTFWSKSWPDWWKQRAADVTGIISEVDKVPGWLKEHITDPISDVFKDIWSQFTDWFWKIIDYALGKFLKTVEWATESFTETILSKVWGAFKWAWDKMTSGISWVIEEIAKLLSHLAPLAPEGGIGALSGLTNIVLIVGGGLAAMTIGGHFCHPFQAIGLGEVASMIYDLCNFKLILGAFMGVMSFCALRTPLTYYFNYILRPRLPDPRESSIMRSRQLITKEDYAKLLGYQGLPDYWHDNMDLLTETRVGYFALANIARNGVFDKELFERDCHRAGYAQEMINMLLDMYQKNASEAVRGLMSGAATNRFKYGYTTEDGFKDELRMLGYSEDQIPVYVAAAKLDYATDYIGNLKTAYQEAVRKGNISMDGYRQALLGLNIVPERVEALVLIERARLKPTEPLTPISPATPTYQTDAGAIEVDTIRRRRRKSLISRDEEIAELIALGMTPDYATAIAHNDDVRLAEKTVAE
jgi:hypothetical protein